MIKGTKKRSGKWISIFWPTRKRCFRNLVIIKICIEEEKSRRMPDENESKNEKISEKREVVFVSDNIMIPYAFWLQIVNLIPFGHPWFTKLLAHNKIFWLLAQKKDLGGKLIKCTACLNCGKKLICQIRETETKLLEKIPWQVIQLIFRVNNVTMQYYLWINILCLGNTMQLSHLLGAIYWEVAKIIDTRMIGICFQESFIGLCCVTETIKRGPDKCVYNEKKTENIFAKGSLLESFNWYQNAHLHRNSAVGENKIQNFFQSKLERQNQLDWLKMWQWIEYCGWCNIQLTLNFKKSYLIWITVELSNIMRDVKLFWLDRNHFSQSGKNTGMSRPKWPGRNDGQVENGKATTAHNFMKTA